MKHLIVCLFAFVSCLVPGSLGAETVTYTETVKGKSTVQSVSITRSAEEGLEWETATGTESVVQTGTEANGMMKISRVTSPEGNWTLTADGDTLTSAGTYKDKAFSGTLALKGRIWSSGFDFPLKWFVLNNMTGTLPFLMINPMDVKKSTEMVLIRDGEDTLDGKKAVRFKLTLSGAMSMFWSAKIWADPVTGDQMKYQGNQGPGTPDMVMTVKRKS